jgi:Rod binding domain-containing protein
MSPDIQTAMTIAKSAEVRAPHQTNDPVAAKRTAQEFEGVFLSQFLSQMFDGISADGPFGGGQGEMMFRSLMLDEYGKQIAAQGGIGLADSVTRELLKTQEAVH